MSRLYQQDDTASLTEADPVESVQILSSKTLYNRPRADMARHLRNMIRCALELYIAWLALALVDALLAV